MIIMVFIFPTKIGDKASLAKFALENGYCENLNARFRNKLLNGELFYSIKQARPIIENWRKHYNTVRHS